MKGVEKMMGTAREILSKNLQQLILSKGIDQKRLSEEIGVSEMSVSNWAKGVKYPRIDKIQAMADYFGVKKSDLIEDKTNSSRVITSTQYTYFPTAISAGQPLDIEGITNYEVINLPDSLLGKYAGHKDLFFAHVNGDSMNRLMPDESLIGIKPITLETLKNGDIVVFSNEHDYSVKQYYKQGDTLIFRPNSDNKEHFDQIYNVNDNITIHGKVVTYIVNLD